MKTFTLLSICLFFIALTSQAGTAPGLAYKYYEGTWTKLPQFDSLTPLKTGTSANVDITVRNRDTHFAMLWQGYITVPAGSTYTFETNSDDGSKFYLGNYSDNASALVDNDGAHWTINKSSSVKLDAGTYAIAISFFQGTNDDIMEVYWSSTSGIARQRIPDNVFTHDTYTASPPTGETGGLVGNLSYYFSSSDGDDSRTSAQAQNYATPWKTLAKLNAVMPSAKPGTAFLLKRGDVFDGTISMSKSGTADSAVILSAYGSGNKPVINGLTSLADWTNVSGNIWQAALKAGPRLNMLTINGTIQMRGRYPNANTPNGGYRTYTSHAGFSTITDKSLSDSVNWTGAEVSIKSLRWMLNTFPITKQNAGTITYPGSQDTMQWEPIDGFGYFIQNDPRTLDQQGEWYYNPSKQTVLLYSTTNPASLNVKAAIADTLARANSLSYAIIDNIAFQGSNRYTLFFYVGNHITVSNCSFNYAGANAVKADQTTNMLFSHNTVSNSNNNGVEILPFCDNTTAEGNTIINSGTLPGLGISGNYAHSGLLVHGSGSVVRNNNVINTGYNGIVMSGSHVEIRNNYVDTFCSRFDDGAGIYTSAAGTNRRMIGNIVLHGVGNTDGTNADSTDRLANAYGLDDNSEYVVIDSNTAAFCSREGVGIHNSHDVQVTNNTIYAIGQRAIGWANDIISPNNPIRNVTVKYNIFFSNSFLPVKNSEGPIVNANALTQFDTRKGNYDELTKFGVSDSNCWMKPFYLNSNDFFRTSYRPIPAGTTVGASQDDSNAYRKYVTLDFLHWQSVFNQDAHSISGTVYPPYTVTSLDSNTFTNGTFEANINYVLNPHASQTDPNDNYITHSWDNTHLDKGALQVSYTPPSGSNSSKIMEAWFVDKEHAKTFLAGHTYRVKFSIMGSADGNTDFRCVLRATGVGESRWMFFKVYKTRSEVELLFTLSKDIPNAFLVVINDDATLCPTWWLDNLTVQESNVTYSDVNDFVRFEYNATSDSKNISLDGTYVDVRNKTYNSAITLAPYTSVILMRKSAASAASETNAASNIMADTSSVHSEQNSIQVAKVNPNPAVDHIQVSIPVTQGEKPAKLTMYSASGSVVKTMQVNIASQPLDINIADLVPGVYIITIDYGGQSFTSKFIKL